MTCPRYSVIVDGVRLAATAESPGLTVHELHRVDVPLRIGDPTHRIFRFVYSRRQCRARSQQSETLDRLERSGRERSHAQK
jgi:hypothetical protein